MDERLRVIEASQGVFLRREAHDLGYDNRAVQALLRHRVWHRVRHGAYCFTDTWAAADAVGRHRIRARAVMRSLGPRVALSHISAVIDHGIDVWGVDLSRVHVTRLDDGAGRQEGDVVHHEGRVDPDEVLERDGHLVVVPARAVLEAATLATVESGLVSADSALHKRLTTPEQIERMFTRMERWRGSQKLHLVTRMADGRAESVGESRSRHLFWAHGLPAPDLQFPVHDHRGVLVGTSDFAWPELRMLGEFDGRVKYGRLLRPGQSPGDVVFEEKRREDLLRGITGYGMFRLVWSDLGSGADTAARFRRQIRYAA
jgi:hypothetical protein